MDAMIDQSGIQIDRGRDGGYLCSRCRWSGRSESTRLMDMNELVKHGKRDHHILDSQLSDFVNEARMVARKIPNAELVAPQTIGAASNFKPLDSAYDRNLARIQCASHKASVSGPVPMPSSDQTSPPIGNAQMMSPVSTATANSMKGTMNQNTPFDGSTTAYAPVNQASQRHLFASVQSSPSILAAPKIRPVSNPSNESTHLRPGYAISYPAVPDFLATCNLQKESNITTKEPNTIDQVSNRGHLSQGASRHMSLNPDTFDGPPGFAAASSPYLKRTHSEIQNPVILKPDATQHIKTRRTTEGMVEHSQPSMLLESCKRKAPPDNTPSRPASRRQIDRPVSRVTATTSQLIRFKQDMPLSMNDVQYREFLRDVRPTVQTDNMKYENLKSDFNQTKSKAKFVQLAAQHYFENLHSQLSMYQTMRTVNPDWLKTAHPSFSAAYSKAHRTELLSLTAQRIFQEHALEIHEQERKEEETESMRTSQRGLNPEIPIEEDNVLYGSPSSSPWTPDIPLIETGQAFAHNIQGSQAHPMEEVNTNNTMPRNWRDAGVSFGSPEREIYANDSMFFDFESAGNPD